MKKIVCLILAFSFFVASDVLAARVEPQKDVAVRGDFDLGPTSFFIKGKPGETIKKSLQVTNRKGFAQKFMVEVEDFQGTGDVGQPIFFSGDKPGKYGAKDWVAVELNEFVIEHGERQFFDVNIRIPENADAGDHYAAVLVSALPSEEEQAESERTAPNITIRSRVGSLFYIQVEGDITEKGELESFKANKRWYEKGPIKFSTVYRNTGTVRLKPFGKIEIRDFRGKMVEEIAVEPFNVLRDSIKQDIRTWETDSWLGMYKAKLVLNLGYGDIIEEKEISFWIVSWKKITIGLVALLLIIFLAVLTQKRVSFSIKIESKTKNEGKNDLEEKSDEEERRK